MTSNTTRKDDLYNEFFLLSENNNFIENIENFSSLKKVFNNITNTISELTKFNEKNNNVVKKIVSIEKDNNETCNRLIDKLNDYYDDELIPSLEEYYKDIDNVLHEELVSLNNFKLQVLTTIITSIYNRMFSNYVSFIEKNNTIDSDCSFDDE